MLAQWGACRLELVQGDITQQEVDAIVNSANRQLAGGGGVDGAIHSAAGPELMDELRARYPRGCETGDAVATSAGKLPAKHVFHAVGPIWRGGHQGEPKKLASAYRRCLLLAVEKECSSIAFPAISTGIYGYPMDLAADGALRVVKEFVEDNSKPPLIRFVLFSAGSYGAFARVLESMSE
jgi:O-acetyl-ADP-ribose deacetylase (regulator of RNase III)